MSDNDTKARSAAKVMKTLGLDSPSARKGRKGGVTNPPLRVWVRARDVGGQIEFDVDDNNNPPPGKKKPFLFGPGTGQHEIVFHLIDNGVQIEFNQQDPIWTEDNVNCGNLTGRNSGQIFPTDARANRLTVLNMNDGPARLVRYQLNFLYSVDNSPAPACDPAILNGGGGSS